MFGYLYLEEKKWRTKVKEQLDELDKHPGWCLRMVQAIKPKAPEREIKIDCEKYAYMLSDIRRGLEDWPVTNLRFCSEKLTILVEKAKEIASVMEAAKAPAPSVGYGSYDIFAKYH